MQPRTLPGMRPGRIVLLLAAALVVGVLVSTILLHGGDPPRPVFTGAGVTAPASGSTAPSVPVTTASVPVGGDGGVDSGERDD